MTSTGMLHSAKLAGQLPPSRGSSSGMVSPAGTTSPISSPFTYTAVASGTRAGNHNPTSVGSAGCMTATPAPITAVIANSHRHRGPDAA